MSKLIQLARTSILNRVMLSVFASIFAVSVVIAIYIIHNSIKDTESNLQNSLSEDLKVISIAVTDTIVIGDYATLKQIMHGYVRDRDIKTIIYTSATGATIVTNDDTAAAHYPSWFANMSGIKDIDGAVDISVGGVNYGKLKVIATPEYYLSRLWEQIFTGLIMFALFIFLNTFFLWNTLRKNLLPALKDIENGAMSIYNGNLSFRVDENSTIELQSTLKAFNAMALAIEEDTEKLKQTELELQSINSELQSRVEVESTKRVESERMLLQQSKMAMMGEMIGAIAHQWRQPLNSLGIYIQDAFLAYKLGEINDEYMNEFKTGSMSIIQRMSKTIDDFRNFFRPNKEKEVFVVEDALRDTLHIMLPQLKSHSINVEFDTSCVNKVFGYKNELEQVVLIMISNAKDVLVDNNIENPKIDILINVDNTSNKVILSIEDNGGGVPEKIIDRIFEPYFTTKEQGKGTGIGLYMAKEIIERQMGGKIYCENIKNGARFVVEVQGYKDSTEQV